ncbi:hypothetical protein Q5P01_009359 [Channa striata]|uniref:Centrosome and spindle pole associated protein 1 n=1 Tax=Channa striata TaxID=64152 RepID=A0AA88N3W5_CHASR|nr:hypothetical protein Q5P01_009359 [Channa striata]
MEMDDELVNFIRERKAKVAEDKASLEQDPPYMEIKVKPHKTHGYTAKENIPPRFHAESKDLFGLRLLKISASVLAEECSSVGLPLGVEYDRKKQRLRHELRMDYRRYMAQKKDLYNKRSLKQRPLEEKADVLPKQTHLSLRDAGTLTEENSGLHWDLGPTEVKILSPEEYEEQSSVAFRHPHRLVRPVDQESEDEVLELTEGRRSRRTAVETTYDMRLSNKADGSFPRGQRENPVDVPKESRRLRARTKNDDAEFTTGLIIGAADTDEAIQRRKERYRQELQEQIAEQHRNKKREKDLELKVAATGANDPEKQPERIRQFGLSWRKDHQVLEPSTTGESESSLRDLSNNERTGVRDKEMLTPEQPHMAFQSPLLEYSSALGLGAGGLPLNSQPVLPSFPRAMDTSRIPLLPPYPPSTLNDVYRTSNGEPHHYYGTRNLPDPNMAYCGHLSVPGATLPVSYWSIPAGGAVHSHLENPSPHSQHSGSSFPEPQIQATSEAATVDTQFRVFPSERARSTRERIQSYRDSLKQQIREQQERRRLEREEEERYEAQLEAEMKNHQPWGRGGGGAPLRDSTGNLIADLNKMHKQNEEAYSNPRQQQRRATAAATAGQAQQPDLSGRVAVHDTNERLSGFTHIHTPQFARGNVFANQPTQQQLQEQDSLKAFLKQQMEEKRLKKAEESERIRLEEEKEEKRLAEQRARIQKEYDEEQERKKRKEMEQKAKNEELIQLAEQRKKEAERKKKEEEEKERAALRRQYERERQARVEEVHREPSPPIPTLQKKRGLPQRTTRPLTVDSQRSAAPLSEHSLSGLQSPPVPARRNQLRAAGNQRDVFNELSALRQQLRSEQKRLESRLHQGDWEEFDSPLSDRPRERPLVDVFEMARLRLQAPVRRPASRNLVPIHDSLQLKYRDGESRLGFSEVPKLEQVGVSSRRRWDYKDPYQQLSSQRSTVQDDYFDLSPPQQSDDRTNVTGEFARGSLLESESAFIDPLGDAFSVPHTSDLEKTPQLSARERRRLARQSQRPQVRASSSRSTGYHEDPFTRTGTVDLSDDDSPPSQFSLHNPKYQTSAEPVAADPWMFPGRSETFKRLESPLRRDWLTT